MLQTNGFYFAYPFQLGPDNQLYIVNGYNYPARLSNPDVWGGATFNDQFIYLKEPGLTIFAGSSLPVFIDAQRKEPDHPDFSIEASSCSTYTFSTPCFDNYTATWNFGDGSSTETGSMVTHAFAQSGNFKVTLSLSSSVKVYGSVTKNVTVLPATIRITGPDSVCNTNNFATQFFAHIDSNVNYRWSVVNGSVIGPNNLTYVNVAWQNNIDSGKIQLELANGSNCIRNAAKTIAIIKRPVFNWVLQDSICISSQPITLKASPEGGTFHGPGVNNGVFSPSISGVGNHELIYRYGDGTICNSQVEKAITVTKSPVFSRILQDSICISGQPLLLKASTEGGTFSGQGVSGQVFTAAIAGVGDHQLIYSYGSQNACSSKVQQTITVKSGCMAWGCQTGSLPMLMD